MPNTDFIRNAFADKSLKLSLSGRRIFSSGSTYYAYAIHYIGADGTWDLLYVTPESEYGYDDHWLNMATEKFVELTGVDLGGAPYIDRWGRNHGLDVTVNVEDITGGERALNAFIAEQLQAARA